MKKTLWLNGALFAAVVALALFAWLKPQKTALAFRLSMLKAAEVNRINIEITGSDPIVLERRQAAWQLVSPVAAHADDFQVQRLLVLLEATAKERFPATGLARFDLNVPYARVTLNQQGFSFGAVNQMSREQYVLTQDGIYLVELRYGAALPKNALQFASRQLFAAEEAPVAFEFKEFKLTQQDGKWQLTPAANAGADDINRWVDAWRLATAQSVLPPGNRKPVATFKVRLKNGSETTLAVLQREPELILARNDRKLEYQFSGAAAQHLLAPPAGQVNSK